MMINGRTCKILLERHVIRRLWVHDRQEHPDADIAKALEEKARLESYNLMDEDKAKTD